MPRLRLHSLLVCYLMSGAAASAQGGRIELPEVPTPAPAEEPATGGEQEPGEESGIEGLQDPTPELWADAQTPAERLFLAFELERSEAADVRQRYLNELRALGLGTESTCVRALSSPYAPTVLLAAELLEWVGDPEHEGLDVVRELVVAASRVPSVEAVSACLETARRLNRGVLPAMAVKLLGHPRRQVRTVGEARLARNPDASHVPSLLQFLSFGRDQDVRLRAARLLAAHIAAEEVRVALRESLGGEDLEVTFVALDALAGAGQPIEIGYLREQAASATTLLESAYLLHALLRLQDVAPDNLFDEGQARLLRRMCDDSDLYVSGVGAACMAEFLFRSDYEEEMERWNALIPALLVRAVGGAEFYPQYARFMPVAEGVLRRISGEDFAGAARDSWTAWYDATADGFQMVRGRLDLSDETAPGLRVTWHHGDAPSSALLGPDAAWRPGDHILGPLGLATVRGALASAGILGTEVLPGSYGPREEAVAGRIEIAIGGRRKVLSFRGPAMVPWVEELFAELDATWDTTRWQRLAAAGAIGPEPILQRLEVFEDAEGSGRATAIAELTRGRAGRLSDELLAGWCADLRATSGLAEAWDDALAAEFLQLAAARGERNPKLARELISLALQAASPQLVEPVAEAFAELEEPLRSTLLVAALGDLGPQAAVAALTDARLPMRVAAVRALGASDGDVLPQLELALDDDHPLVVRAALRSLGERADPTASAAVARFAQIGMPLDLQREALWALGRMGAAEAIPVLETAAAHGDDASVRIAAVDGLALVEDAEASAALGRLFPEFADGDLESSWMRAAIVRGGGAARAMLEGYLLDGDLTLARRSAVLSGRLGSPAAALALVELLDTAPRDSAVLEALAMTLGVDFRSMPDPAGTYRAWWEQYGELGPAGWLRRAAGDSGFVLDPEFHDMVTVSRRDTASVLLAALAEGPGSLRGLAAYYLHAMTGVDTEAVLLGTPRHELQRRIQPWRDWLAEAE